MSYQEALSYLYRLQEYGIAPGLDRIQALLSCLDHPQKSFPAVHIGGTNGKGSTAAMVASVLQQAGYRVGLYTSPHLIDFSERIRVNGLPISHEEIVSLTKQIQKAVKAATLQMTFFEFATAMAFCYFRNREVDITVVEVGLGGRWDATNLVIPQVTAITQIDLDHEEYLGTTLLEIAREKAGIIKEGVPLLTGATEPHVLSYFEEVAHSKRAPLIQLGREITVSGEGPDTFLYRGVQERTVHCPLMGRHQMINTALAIGIIEQLQKHLAISEKSLLEGIRQVEWPGRLQVIRTSPLILLDGAHNPAGATALFHFLQEVDSHRLGKHWMIIGILKDKNFREILALLSLWADEIVLTRADVHRAADPSQLLSALDAPIQKTVQKTVPTAIHYVEARMKPQDTLVITGSLYVVGEALAFFQGTTPSPLRGL